MVPHSILIIGLGELGHEVVRFLAGHEHRDEVKLAVMLREPADTTKRHQRNVLLCDWDVVVVSGDVIENSQTQLAERFSHFHTVICCTGMSMAPEIQIKIAKAALEAKVERYFPWQFGIEYDQIGRNSSQNLFDSQLDVRELLRSQSKTEWVIISTGIFISFLFEPSFGLVSRDMKVVTGIGSWDNAITATSPGDIGRITAEIALMHPKMKGVVYVSGDTISMRRLADVTEAVTGEKVDRVLKTVDDLTDELTEEPDNDMRKYRVVFAEGKGTSWAKEDSFNFKHGIRTQTVDDWARQNL